jgi:thymidylate synthase
MNSYDSDYLGLLMRIMETGTVKEDRTGVGTKSISGTTIQHDMKNGFPALTLKKLPFKTMAVELEGFLKGITDKVWYKDKSCNIWNEWSRPDKTAHLTGEELKKAQLDNRDLGPIYGWQLRHFGGEYDSFDSDYSEVGWDQLSHVINRLRMVPTDRRLLVSYWDPDKLSMQALPPCHYSWQVIARNQFLDIVFNMRSVDMFLGFPFDFAHYALLVSLLARQTGLIPGTVTAFMGDTHIYKNQFDAVKELSKRDGYALPSLTINNEFEDARAFTTNMVSLQNYISHDAIKVDIAV